MFEHICLLFPIIIGSKLYAFAIDCSNDLKSDHSNKMFDKTIQLITKFIEIV